jgi:hypothetical protein
VKNNAIRAEVKLYSQLAKLKTKITGNGAHRYGRYDREQIDEIKRALLPHLPSLCQKFFPAGVLSRTGEYWVIPALEICINLTSGDFFLWPTVLSRRQGDFISLYAMLYDLPFRQAVATLARIARDVKGIPPEIKIPRENFDREKRRIVHAALFGSSDPLGPPQMTLSALQIRRRVVSYLDTHAEAYPRVKEEHPEFFLGAAFARLLEKWSNLPEAEFFYIQERSRGAKKTLFLLRNVTQ